MIIEYLCRNTEKKADETKAKVKTDTLPVEGEFVRIQGEIYSVAKTLHHITAWTGEGAKPHDAVDVTVWLAPLDGFVATLLAYSKNTKPTEWDLPAKDESV